MARKNARAIHRSESREIFDGNLINEERHDAIAYQRIKDLNDAFYGGIDPRRRQEMADAGMIQEDQRAMANLPTQARHMQYPSLGFYSTPFIDDMKEE